MAESVTIVGAGIAGLTAALRLAERGYDVTIYDQHSFIGGNLAAIPHTVFKDPDTVSSGPPRQGDVCHEHCYHMFLNWYLNFWHLVENDLGMKRSDYFEARTAVQHLRRGEFPHFRALANPGSPGATSENFNSGLERPADLFLWSYSMIDLASETFRRDDLLDQQSVTGFLRSRYYATNRSAAMHQDTLAKAFASPGYLSSASSYKNFVRYGLRQPDPMMWVLKGNSYDSLLKFLFDKLHETRHCTFELERKVTGVKLVPSDSPAATGQVTGLRIQKQIFNSFTCSTKDEEDEHGFKLPSDFVPVSNLILALPPRSLADLIAGDDIAVGQDAIVAGLTDIVVGQDAVTDQQTIISDDEALIRYLPSIGNIRRLRSASIASLDLYFKKKLTIPDPGNPSGGLIAFLPKEHVVLVDSRFGLTFVDNSLIWTDDPRVKDVTVLSIAATNFYALPTETSSRYDGYEVIKELHEFMTNEAGVSAFNPGRRWGDADSDIDWERSYFQSNAGDQLVLNETGSEQNRPKPHYPELPNVFFAGDFCENPIDVITVEGAVVSGLRAAQALHSLRTSENPIEILEPEAYPENYMLGWKLLLSPLAYAAKAWSTLSEVVSSGSDRSTRQRFDAAASLMWAPYQFAADWCRTAWSFWSASLFGQKHGDGH